MSAELSAVGQLQMSKLQMSAIANECWVTGFCDVPILKRLIAVNMFVSPWGLKIFGSDVLSLGGWGWG